MVYNKLPDWLYDFHGLSHLLFTEIKQAISLILVWLTKLNVTLIQNDLLQLNKYKTDPYFLQDFQSNTMVCLIIHAFCKVYKCEIVFILICRTGRTILGSQLVHDILLAVIKFQRRQLHKVHIWPHNDAPTIWSSSII